MTSQTEVRTDSASFVDRLNTIRHKTVEGIIALDLGTKAKKTSAWVGRKSTWAANKMRGLSGDPSAQRLGLYLSRLSDRELEVLGLERSRLFGEIEARFNGSTPTATPEAKPADAKSSDAKAA